MLPVTIIKTIINKKIKKNPKKTTIYIKKYDGYDNAKVSAC